MTIHYKTMVNKQDYDRLRKKFGSFADQVVAHTNQDLAQIGVEALNEITSPWAHPTMWDAVPNAHGWIFGFVIQTTSAVFKYLDKGTRAHRIAARNAKALHWVEAGGGDAFAKSVWNPGLRPRNYSKQVLQQLQKNSKIVLKKNMTGWWDGK